MVEGRVRSIMVIFEDIVREEACALGAGAVRACIGPLAGDGLDEALGLAVGLWAVGAGELVFDGEAGAGGGKGVGSITDAAIGEDALDGNAVEGVEADGLLQGGDDAGDLFIGQDAGEGDPGAIINGDMQGFDAGTLAAIGAVAGAPDAGAHKAAELLDIEVEEFAGMVALVTQDRRRCRIKGAEAVEAVAAKDA